MFRYHVFIHQESELITESNAQFYLAGHAADEQLVREVISYLISDYFGRAE